MKIKKFLAIAISILPFNILRVFFYNTLLRYKIKNSKIGWLSVIAVKSFYAENAYIAYLNIFTGSINIKIESNAQIAPFNFFKGSMFKSSKIFKNSFLLKEGAWITSRHYFDVSGEIIIGKNSVIAGIGSQFWTHGTFKNRKNSVIIGDDCYIGSNCKFAPGSSVNDKSLVAIGSVITKEFNKNRVVIAGVPAKIIKENIYWREEWE